ncbi:HAAS signaling domain-containing protein [Staphylococcus shinii]|uniref:HAAS signaling domain-containing protein n=1 Tax=Staphylococcus shinii TaxID=2912228 RepID=UPI003CE9BED1
MRRTEYLKILHKHLKHLDDNERQDIINEYDTHFYSGMEEEKTEDQISEELGDPQQLAKQLNANASIEKAEQSNNISDVSHAVVSVMGLSLLNFFVILIPFIIILSIVLSLIVTTLSFIFTPIALLVKAVMVGFQEIMLLEVYTTGVLFGLGLILFVITYLITKGFYILCVKYLKWNIKVVKGSATR